MIDQYIFLQSFLKKTDTLPIFDLYIWITEKRYLILQIPFRKCSTQYFHFVTLNNPQKLINAETKKKRKMIFDDTSSCFEFNSDRSIKITSIISHKTE